MKKLALILFLLSSSFGFAQSSGWFWQNPLPQGNNLSNLQFFNTATGYCLSYDQILKTTNSGTNWAMISTRVAGKQISMSFTDVNTGYILCDSGLVLKTTNAGLSWLAVSDINSPFARFIYCINNSTGFAVFYMQYYQSGSLIYRTTNGGSNWDQVFSSSTDLINSIMFVESGTGYAAGSVIQSQQTKIVKTTDYGSNWVNIPQSLSYNFTDLFMLNENSGYGCGVYGQNAILKTTDGCHNWIGQNCPARISNLDFLDLNNGWALKDGMSILSTTNGGLNWNVLSTLYPISGSALSLCVVNSNSAFVTGWGGRISRSVNGGLNWSYQTSGNHNYLNCSKFINEMTGYAAGLNTLLKTTNAGNNWLELNNDSASNYLYLYMDFVDQNTGFAGRDVCRMTTNGGTNWRTLTNFPQPSVSCVDIHFPTHNTGYLIDDISYMYKTTDLGNSWVQLSSPFAQYRNCVYFLNNDTGFIGAALLYKTTNGGTNWNTIYFPVSTDVVKISFINNNTGFVACYNGYVLKTTNGGTNWVVKADFQGQAGFNCVSFANQYTGYEASSNGRVIKTTDGGENWFFLSSITNNYISSMYFSSPLTGYLIGDNGTIIKTTTGGEPIGIQPISNEVPGSFSLYQNYPNPFNPVTVIKFQVASYKFVKLVIYDILGRKVTILVNEQLKPGTYEVEWNEANYASGVYFYQLTSGDYVQTRKMVLLK